MPRWTIADLRAYEDRQKHRGKPVVGSETAQSQQRVSQTLDRKPRSIRGGKARMVVCVTIVSHRRRLVDDDNLSGSSTAKSLRDCIAAELKIDDGDPRIKFEYQQIETTGAQGTSVTISKL